MVIESIKVEDVDTTKPTKLTTVNAGTQATTPPQDVQKVWFVRVCSTLTVFTTIGLLIYLKYQGDLDSEKLRGILTVLLDPKSKET